MRQGLARAAAIGALAVVPAVALGSSTTYNGDFEFDSQATIELKITDANERRVKQVIVKKLPYQAIGNCTSSGRTARVKLKGDFRVKDSGKFRAVGAGETSDPLTDGQLNVIGEATKNKVTGKAKFTFGKDGCETDVLEFKATK